MRPSDPRRSAPEHCAAVGYSQSGWLQPQPEASESRAETLSIFVDKRRVQNARELERGEIGMPESGACIVCPMVCWEPPCSTSHAPPASRASVFNFKFHMRLEPEVTLEVTITTPGGPAADGQQGGGVDHNRPKAV